MRSIAIVAFLALLIMPCIAVPDSVTTGHYKVTFDLGIPKEAYKVEVETPKTSESLSGDVSTEYNIEVTNITGLVRSAYIILTSFETDQVIPTQKELLVLQRKTMSKMEFQDIQTAGRKIDGIDGVVGSAKIDIDDSEIYGATYYPSSAIRVDVVSTYPWDEGTLLLLKTIHIEKVNAA